ncbi:MAG: AAA family ATPase, partial [Chloroflexi bacterium]|nr:AAA family ATPase [Chloroflexota bacterium]
MIIKRITIKRFRAIKQEKTFEFSPGLNVIKGTDNEAGKTSLRMALVSALFQDSSTSNKNILSQTSWGTDEPWEINLEFENNIKTYRLTKNLKDKSVALVDLSTGTTIATDKNAVSKIITEFTGCPSQSFFESTACIGQEEMIGLIPEYSTHSEQQKVTGFLHNRLQGSLSGTSKVNILPVIDKLYNKTHRKDARGPLWNLNRINERESLLQKQKTDLETQFKRITDNRREQNRVKEELNELDCDLPQKKELLDKNTTIIELKKQIENEQNQWNNYKKVKELKTQLETLELELKPYTAFIGAHDRVEQVNSAYGQYQAEEKDAIVAEKDFENVNSRKTVKWPVITGLLLIIFGLGMMGTTAYTGIAAIPGVILLFYWFFALRSWRREVEQASLRAAREEEHLQNIEQELKTLLRNFNCSDYAEFKHKTNEYRPKLDKRNDIASRLKGMTGNINMAKFEEEHSIIELSIMAKTRELEKLEPFKLQALQYQQLYSEVTTKLNKQVILKTNKGALDKFFEYLDMDTDQLAGIDEELIILQQEKEFWEKKQKVFDITREGLEEASRQTFIHAANALEYELGKHVSMITEGRYSKVKIHDDDLSIHTFS